MKFSHETHIRRKVDDYVRTFGDAVDFVHKRGGESGARRLDNNAVGVHTLRGRSSAHSSIRNSCCIGSVGRD